MNSVLSKSPGFSVAVRTLCAAILLAFFVAGLNSADASGSGDAPGASSLIPESLISLGGEGETGHVLLVEKQSQSLLVYESNGNFALKHRFNCSTGQADGKKEVLGDCRTPEGVYFFTNAFSEKELSPVYGWGAFVLDYPNLLDRKAGRNGGNIWLHGTDKAIKPRDSRGCVAMNNQDLKAVAEYIELNRTPIIIKDSFKMVPADGLAAARESLTRFLQDWNDGFLSGDKDRHAQCYETLPSNHGALWAGWDRIREIWQEGRIPFELELRHVSLLQGNPCVVAIFDEVLRVGGSERILGTKKLFIEDRGGAWRIAGESYQTAEPGIIDASLFTLGGLLLASLDTSNSEYQAIADRVLEWTDAWSSGDLALYEACYAGDFSSRGMDLAGWIRAKKELKRRYDWIKVAVKDLRIERNGNAADAWFRQEYRSSGFEATTLKHLELKRLDGEWKIYRETCGDHETMGGRR